MHSERIHILSITPGVRLLRHKDKLNMMSVLQVKDCTPFSLWVELVQVILK